MRYNNAHFIDKETENKIKKLVQGHDEPVTICKQVITEHLLCARTILGFGDTVANKTKCLLGFLWGREIKINVSDAEVPCAMLFNGDRRT